MSSFKDLKRNSSAGFDKLNKELSKLNQTFGGKDERLWSCQTDKAGNGYAVIRFLPAPGNEDTPFVRLWTHGFQGPGGWYIENSLTTIGEQDPIAELNTRLWNSGVESDKETVRKQKRQLNYYSNIYVVKDPANPANEGKVFLFRYGKKIFDQLKEVMNPAEDPLDPKDPINPFDLWTGANFKLKIRRVEGYANYDKSEFESPSPLLGDDDELEKIWKSEYSLQEMLDKKNFKSYEELEKQLNRALGNRPGTSNKPNTEDDTAPWKEDTGAKFKEKAAVSAPADFSDNMADDDDDVMAEFRRLAEED